MNFTQHMNETCKNAKALLDQGKVNEASELIRLEAAKNPILKNSLQSIDSQEKVKGAFSKGFTK